MRKKWKFFQGWDENDTKTKTDFLEMGGKVFNSLELNKTMNSEMRFIMPTSNPQLITDDFNVINEIACQIHYLSKMTKGNSFRAESLRSGAGRLLVLIQAEYKLRWWKIFCLISCNFIGNCILVLSLDWIDIIANINRILCWFYF